MQDHIKEKHEAVPLFRMDRQNACRSYQFSSKRCRGETQWRQARRQPMETGKETARRALGGDRGRGQGGARGQG